MDTSAPRPGSSMMWTGVALGLLGVVALGFATFRIASVAGDLIGSGGNAVPGTFVETLEAESHTLWIHVGDEIGGQRILFDQQGELDQLQISDPAGDPVDTSTPVGDQTLVRNGKVLSAFADFDVEIAGDHEFVIDDGDTTEVVVAQSIGNVGWIGLGSLLAGIGLLVVGIGLFLVGLVRRRRPTPSATPPAAPRPESPHYKPGTPYVPGGTGTDTDLPKGWS